MDLLPQGNGQLKVDPSLYLSTFDNVIHLFLREEGENIQPYARILKSLGNEYIRRAFPIH